MSLKKLKDKNKLDFQFEEEFKDGTIFASIDSDNCFREDYIFFDETRKQKKIRTEKFHKYKAALKNR